MLWVIISLVAFFGIWFGVALYGKGKQWSATLCWGGGFMAACIGISLGFSLLHEPQAKPQDATVAPESAKPMPKNLGRTYGQLMAGMDEYFTNMENSRLATGETRRMGQSDHTKAMAIYEIVGEQGAPVSRVSLSFFAVSDSRPEGKVQSMKLNLGAMAVTAIMVKNVFPDWQEGPKAVMDNLLALPKRKLKSGQTNESKMERDDKVIELSYLKELGMFTVAIGPSKD